MPRGFLVKRRAEGAWPVDDDVITSSSPVSSHESPDSGYGDVTSGPAALMTSLRAATNIYQQLLFRRHAETIMQAAAAAAKTGNGSFLPTGSSSSAGLFPVCSLPLTPYLIPAAAVGHGAPVALNLSSRSLEADEPKTGATADDTGQNNTLYNHV